ncbi:MAG: preprotein translocase subunit SecG [Chloroflexi bacterium]|nr:preprotein translocase subunit SecG [Chloroflexota bacterium]MCI0889167.1 preprotein translocase subunit SecG [Chloroflexota bacterium]
MSFENYLNLAQMLISIILVVVVLLQARGGDIGAAFGGGGGGGGSSFRTRRGLEKTLFQLTIVLSMVFLAMSAVSVRYAV